MKIVIFYLSMLALNSVPAAANGGRFVLQGNVKGQTAGYVYLSYQTGEGTYRKDSCRVKNTAFRFEGDIDEAQMAYFSGPVKSRSMDDPDYTSFFIEPGVITLTTKVHDFKNAIIKGSGTQDEYAALESAKNIIQARYKKQLDSLRTIKDHEKAAEVRERLSPYFNEMNREDVLFFDKHPQSYVTLFMLRFHTGRLPLDSLQLFYDRLGAGLQATASGMDIAKELRQLKAGSPRSIAHNFTTKDINGQTLSLSDFKGKYVLLDFWASWCVPCRKGNPHLKELYSKYSAKDIEFIGVSDDDSHPEEWRKAVEKDGLPWRHVLRGLDWESLRSGSRKENPDEISDKFGIHSLPTKILIDPDGKIIGRYSEEEGPLDEMLITIFGS